MQHYGAPTRLLDWTYSFFVAIYFALEESNENCCVWALSQNWIVDKVKLVLSKRIKNGKKSWNLLRKDRNVLELETVKEAFMKEPPLIFVYPINPFRLHDRLVIQQGLFLCPGNIAKPFEDNLKYLQAYDSNPNKYLIKLLLPKALDKRNEILRHLYRINITRATLFPGLDGFAQSLKTLMVIPEIIKPSKIKNDDDFIGNISIFTESS